MTRRAGLLLRVFSQASLDQLADRFGARRDAVGPAEVVDLFDEIVRHGDDDATLFRHGPIVPWGQLQVNVPTAYPAPGGNAYGQRRRRDRCGGRIGDDQGEAQLFDNYVQAP